MSLSRFHRTTQLLPSLNRTLYREPFSCRYPLVYFSKNVKQLENLWFVGYDLDVFVFQDVINSRFEECFRKILFINSKCEWIYTMHMFSNSSSRQNLIGQFQSAFFDA